MKIIVAKEVPAWLKLSEIAKVFEEFGELVRISVDEKKRTKHEKVNTFVTYADQNGAKRALEKGTVNINGQKVTICEYDDEIKLKFRGHKMINGHHVGNPPQKRQRN